jgi:hypothetical protein
MSFEVTEKKPQEVSMWHAGAVLVTPMRLDMLRAFHDWLEQQMQADGGQIALTIQLPARGLNDYLIRSIPKMIIGLARAKPRAETWSLYGHRSTLHVEWVTGSKPNNVSILGHLQDEIRGELYLKGQEVIRAFGGKVIEDQEPERKKK